MLSGARQLIPGFLIFHMTTTILAKIPQQSLISDDKLQLKSDTEHQELLILYTLVTFIIINHTYIIATVGSHFPGEELEILV